MRFFKVVKQHYDPNAREWTHCSLFARDKAKIRFSTVKSSQPTRYLRDAGYYITCFRSFEDALAWAEKYTKPGREIWAVDVPDWEIIWPDDLPTRHSAPCIKTKQKFYDHLNQHEHNEIENASFYYADIKDLPWPKGTHMVKSCRLLERVAYVAWTANSGYTWHKETR